MMKAILLDGSHADDRTGARVGAVLAAQCHARGWDVEHVVLREKNIGNCAGDFLCWVRTPGLCNVDDDNRAIAAAVVSSDVLVYLSPVTFGGYSSALKRMVDHQIQNVSPLFAKVEGETHHQKRYSRYPDFLAVGWLDAPDAQAEAVFRHLAQRNAINFHAKTHVSDVISTDRPDADLLASAQNWLDRLQHGRSSDRVSLPASTVAGGEAPQVHRALLLVGSPKTHKSNSNALGGYLYERLAAQSIRTETMYLHNVLRFPGSLRTLFAAVDAADLVTLAFPLYVDSLPGAVTDALERIAAHRQGQDVRRQGFAGIANSGFPEAHHSATALAICAAFARRARFAWAGSLAVGGGEMVGGVPLTQGGGRTLRMRTALAMAAEALAQGRAIPIEAQDLLDRPVVPHWVYRWMGGWHWRQQAKRYGAQHSLRQQPYAPMVR